MTKPTVLPADKLINRVLCMLNDTELEQLEAVCKSKYRSKSFIMREAFQQYLSTQQTID